MSRLDKLDENQLSDIITEMDRRLGIYPYKFNTSLEGYYYLSDDFLAVLTSLKIIFISFDWQN